MKEIFYAKIENKIIIEYPENNEQNCISLDYNLYQHCLSLGQVEFNGAIEEGVYTIADKDLFTQCQAPILDLGVEEPGLEEISLDHEYRISKLELGV